MNSKAASNIAIPFIALMLMGPLLALAGCRGGDERITRNDSFDADQNGAGGARDAQVQDDSTTSPLVVEEETLARTASGDGARELTLDYNLIAQRMPIQVVANRSFRKVGLRWDANSNDQALEAQTLVSQAWTPWAPVPITWHEEIGYNGRIVLDSPATELRIRTTDGRPLAHLSVEFFDAP